MANSSNVEEENVVDIAYAKLKDSISSKNMVSYTDTISMWSGDDIDDIIDGLRKLRDEADDFSRNSFDKAENDIIYCDWYNTATCDSEFYDYSWNNVINGTGLASETLKNIFYDDEKEAGGLKGFNDVPNFSHLISAIIELRDAVVNYSKGIDVDAAKDVINTFHPNFLSSSPYSGYTAPATLEAPEFEKVASVENTSVVSTDDIDGAENIPMEDSITDDITNVSAKDLLEDAVKSSDGNSTLVTAGAASVLSGAGVVGAGISQGIKSSIAKLGKNVDELEDEKSDEDDEDIIEADEPISSLEDDLASSVSNFVEPELEKVSINGKKVQGKQSSIIIGTGAGAVGVTTAGVLAGKTYMDKKKSEDEDGSEDDDNKFDDFEFENLEEKQEETVNNNDSNENVVDFKSKIMDDNL